MRQGFKINFLDIVELKSYRKLLQCLPFQKNLSLKIGHLWNHVSGTEKGNTPAKIISLVSAETNKV